MRPTGKAALPARREIAEDLFRDHVDLDRIRRAMRQAGVPAGALPPRAEVPPVPEPAACAAPLPLPEPPSRPVPAPPRGRAGAVPAVLAAIALSGWLAGTLRPTPLAPEVRLAMGTASVATPLPAPPGPALSAGRAGEPPAPPSALPRPAPQALPPALFRPEDLPRAPVVAAERALVNLAERAPERLPGLPERPAGTSWRGGTAVAPPAALVPAILRARGDPGAEPRMPARPVAAAAASPVPRPRPLQAELAAAAGPAMERALAPIAAARVVIHHAAGSEAPRALAGKLRQAGAGEVEIRKVGFPVRSPSVRYFRAGDREKAAAACRLSFGTCRDELADFTGYRPLSRAGTVEVWLP